MSTGYKPAETGVGPLPPIFKRYPGLSEKVPWLPLGTYPTRVHRLGNCGHDGLWIKREDESSPLYGGNKIRKLEFALADAKAQGKSSVVTMGGLGTNHGLATAIFCGELGLRCTLLLFDQPVNDHVRTNMLLFRRYGAVMKYGGSLLATALKFYSTERIIRPGAYFLPPGGSYPVGVLGVINAVFELKKQIDEGRMPLPRHIISPLGSSGTAAGLSLGVMLAGMETTVWSVRVTVDRAGPFPVASAETVKNLMKETLISLRRSAEEVPRLDIPPQRVIEGYIGDGYGCDTPECRAAVDFIKAREGIVLDPTYTGKTFAAVMDFIKNPAYKNDTILYWHTYNSADLTGEAVSVDYHDLPERFHPFFTK